MARARDGTRADGRGRALAALACVVAACAQARIATRDGRAWTRDGWMRGWDGARFWSALWTPRDARLVRPETLASAVDARAVPERRSGALARAIGAWDVVWGRKIWLGVLGEAFDVTAGARYYAGDGEYARCFAGRDATRAFVTGDFTERGCVSDVRGLTGQELSGARGWRDFMRGKYRYVGKIAGGAFYDDAGEPTAMMREVWEKLERFDAFDARRRERVRMFPDCSSRWSVEAGGFVWCDADASGVARYPRNETSTSDSGENVYRCACFPDMTVSSSRALFPDCAATDVKCRVSQPSPAA